MIINWHYPRPDLTENVINAFDQGSSTTLTLFAPRRMGKTEFVLYDLIPEASKRGYVPVYASFWDNRDDPTSALLQAIKGALAQKGWFRRTTKGIGGAGAPDSATLAELRAQFNELLRKNNRILLCLDEAQHLATSTAFESLVFFLRTIMEQCRPSPAEQFSQAVAA